MIQLRITKEEEAQINRMIQFAAWLSAGIGFLGGVFCTIIARFLWTK